MVVQLVVVVAAVVEVKVAVPGSAPFGHPRLPQNVHDHINYFI